MKDFVLDEQDKKNFIQAFLDKQAEEEATSNALISDDSYMLWIVSFLESLKDKGFTGEGFNDDDWAYNGDDISEVDKENISKLHLLVDIATGCANANYINTTIDSDFSEESVFIQFKDKRIHVGTVCGQGCYSFVRIVDGDVDGESIPWEIIKGDELLPSTKKKQEALVNLITHTISVIDSGVDKSFIISLINKIE